jgi:hypothetical protein
MPPCDAAACHHSVTVHVLMQGPWMGWRPGPHPRPGSAYCLGPVEETLVLVAVAQVRPQRSPPNMARVGQGAERRTPTTTCTDALVPRTTQQCNVVALGGQGRDPQELCCGFGVSGFGPGLTANPRVLSTDRAPLPMPHTTSPRPLHCLGEHAPFSALQQSCCRGSKFLGSAMPNGVVCAWYEFRGIFRGL